MHISKAEFARRCERSPAAVSHWISSGILTGAALVTDGGEERIDETVARQQLAARLDAGQQLAQPKPLGLEAAALDDDDEDFAPTGSSKDRVLKARAESLELDAEEKRRRLALQTGRYLDADEAKRAWGKQIAAALTEIDMWVGDAARELAGELALDERLVTLALRKSFRAFRERQAAAAQGQLAAPTAQAAE